MTRAIHLSLFITVIAATAGTAAAQPATVAEVFEVAGIARAKPPNLDAILPETIPGFGTRTEKYAYPTGINVWVSGGVVITWTLDADGALYLARKTKDPVLHWLFSDVFGKPPEPLRARFGEPTIAKGEWSWTTSGATATKLSVYLAANGSVKLVRVTDLAAYEAQKRAVDAKSAAFEIMAKREERSRWPYPASIAPLVKAACMRRTTPPRTAEECDCVVSGLSEYVSFGLTWGSSRNPENRKLIDALGAACGP